MSATRRTPFHHYEPLLFVALFAAVSCSSSPAPNTPVGDGGPEADMGPKVQSGLPIPPGSTGVPRPSGTPGNLKVLDWAGFKSALTYTFDDAQPSQIEHYAELQATGVRLTFFVTSGNSG